MTQSRLLHQEPLSRELRPGTLAQVIEEATVWPYGRGDEFEYDRFLLEPDTFVLVLGPADVEFGDDWVYVLSPKGRGSLWAGRLSAFSDR